MKAIETRYKGFRFRSRLEARFAVLLDAIGLEYQFEPEGYELDDGERYLPDFWVSRFAVWVELKPRAPSEREIALAKWLAKESGSAVLFGVGLFDGDRLPVVWGTAYRANDSTFPWALYACSDCRDFGLYVVDDGDVQHCPACRGRLPRLSIFLDAAWMQAKGAHFEHGHSPEVQRLTVPPRLPAGIVKADAIKMMEAAGYPNARLW